MQLRTRLAGPYGRLVRNTIHHKEFVTSLVQTCSTPCKSELARTEAIRGPEEIKVGLVLANIHHSPSLVSFLTTGLVH